MDISGNFSNIMLQYNKNIRDYNDNMRIFLQVIQLQQQPINVNQSVNQNVSDYNTFYYSRPLLRRTNNIFSSLFTSDIPLRQNNDNLQNVIVRPSEEQIENATETIRFDENISYNNTTCPITLVPFLHGENICRIKYCSHLFTRNALHDWFRRNVRCPVCRYDIREYQMNDNTDTHLDNADTYTVDADNHHIDVDADNHHVDVDVDADTHNHNEETSVDNDFDEIVNELLNENIINQNENPRQREFTRNVSSVTNVIRDFINNELANLPADLTTSGSELLYTFDIPLSLDMSGNLRL